MFFEHRLQPGGIADEHAAVLALCERATEGGEAAAYDKKVSWRLGRLRSSIGCSPPVAPKKERRSELMIVVEVEGR